MILIGRGLDCTQSLGRLIGEKAKKFKSKGCAVVRVRGKKKFTVSGDDGEGVPPVPIPNTEVKPFSADGTWLDTARESRTLPEFYSSVAQWQSTRLLTELL